MDMKDVEKAHVALKKYRQFCDVIAEVNADGGYSDHELPEPLPRSVVIDWLMKRRDEEAEKLRVLGIEGIK